MDKSAIERLFQAADGNICVNTAYPLDPSWFAPYRSDEDLFRDVHALSYYLHIPFCKTLCRYCEYTRFRSGNEEAESHYVDLICRQYESYIKDHKVDLLRGFDIGGGTPTAVSLPTFKRILGLYREMISGVERDRRFSSSMEFSFDTITDEKIEAMAGVGFSRVSSGVQAVGKWFDDEYGRSWTGVEWIRHVHDAMIAAGIGKLNLDLMYGFPGQGEKEIKDSVRVISEVMPEQVTLYEVRYNQNQVVPKGVTRDLNFRMYAQLYGLLVELGYKGEFGDNAFSLDGKLPVSSYIDSRMDDAFPYKGFGVSAQSMSDHGISYNVLKGERGEDIPEVDVIGERDVYSLPGDELAAKYISIALYGGKFNMRTVSRLLGRDGEDHFANELDYLVTRGLIRSKASGIYRMTESGVRYAGAVGSLFWPEEHALSLSNPLE